MNAPLTPKERRQLFALQIDRPVADFARFTRPMTPAEEWWNMVGWERWERTPLNHAVLRVYRIV